MGGRWDSVACLTLCALAAPATGCRGPEKAISSYSTAPEAGVEDVSAPSDDGQPVDVADDVSAGDDADVSSDAKPSLDADILDVKSVPDRRPVSDARSPDGGSPGPIFYPTDVIHSPITASVADVLRKIASTVPTRETHNFLKAGDTIMGNALGSPDLVLQSDFFGCAESPPPFKDLGNYQSLQATIDYFHEGNAGGRTPFARVSQCTRENFASWDLLSEQLLPPEIVATNPSFAFVMFGSIDIFDTGTFEPSPNDDWRRFRDYGQAMLEIEDTLIAAGVVPVILSMPPRAWKGGSMQTPKYVVQAPTYVAITRAIAQGRQTPFVNFYLPMDRLPDKGLDPDGLHITQYDIGMSTANCVFSEEGLQHGYNILNLVGLQALERVKEIVVDGEEELESTAPLLPGKGTADAPFEVPGLPFSDLRDLGKATSRSLDAYAGCSDAKETGGEYVYRWNAAASTRVRAVVVDRKGSPVAAHVYHLAGAPTAASCVASQSSNPSNGGLSAGTLSAGTHYFAVDSSDVAPGSAAEYMLVLVECDPTDMTCN